MFRSRTDAKVVKLQNEVDELSDKLTALSIKYRAMELRWQRLEHNSGRDEPLRKKVDSLAKALGYGYHVEYIDGWVELDAD